MVSPLVLGRRDLLLSEEWDPSRDDEAAHGLLSGLTAALGTWLEAGLPHGCVDEVYGGVRRRA